MQSKETELPAIGTLLGVSFGVASVLLAVLQAAVCTEHRSSGARSLVCQPEVPSPVLAFDCRRPLPKKALL